MSFLKHNKGKLIWLLCCVLLVLLFALFKSNQDVMEAVSSLAVLINNLTAAACSLLPFSIAEIIYTLFFIAILVVAIAGIIKAIKQKRVQILAQLLLLECCLVLSVAAGMSFFWGAKYYAPSFQQQSNFVSQPVNSQQLYEATSFFVQKLNETSYFVPRDAQGVCNVSYKDMLAQSGKSLEPLLTDYPFLKGRQYNAKPMTYSRFFSALGFTGYFFPFTGEANINVDTPSALIPSTITHEMAHVRGIAAEQEANFVAVRACELSKDITYQYSGWLLGYIHLSNALFSADYEKWAELSQALPQGAIIDLNINNEYWKQFEGPVADAADKAYTGFLKGYDQKMGMKSYGACVDLLVKYYVK